MSAVLVEGPIATQNSQFLPPTVAETTTSTQREGWVVTNPSTNRGRCSLTLLMWSSWSTLLPLPYANPAIYTVDVNILAKRVALVLLRIIRWKNCISCTFETHKNASPLYLFVNNHEQHTTRQRIVYNHIVSKTVRTAKWNWNETVSK